MNRHYRIIPVCFFYINTTCNYGVILQYNNKEKICIDSWKSIPTTDLDILRKLWKSKNYEVETFMNLIKNNKKSIYIGKTFYKWDKIKHMFGVDKNKLYGKIHS